MKPKISIITLTYNRPQFIGRAIDSVVAQSFESWELIIVQDGRDEQVMEAVSLKIKEHPTRIRHLIRERKGNIAEATNAGIQIARGEFIAILDDDDVWSDRDKLMLQFSYMTKHPEIGLCGGGAIVVDVTGTELLRYKKASDHDTIIKQALLANPIVHSTAMYRSELASIVKGYDVSLACFQDWDFVLKMGLVTRLANIDAYFLRYTRWEGSSSATRQRSNAVSAWRIVRRYSMHYPSNTRAHLIALGYTGYAYLPAAFRRRANGWASIWKKRIFSQGTHGL